MEISGDSTSHFLRLLIFYFNLQEKMCQVNNLATFIGKSMGSYRVYGVS
ncbi:hypothetical protein ES708_01626 [subsurface metagenome]